MAKSAGTFTASRARVGAQIFASNLNFGDWRAVQVHNLVKFNILCRNYGIACVIESQDA